MHYALRIDIQPLSFDLRPLTSLIYKLDFTSVALWTNGEVQPVVTCPAVVLEDEFVEVLAALIADVQQDGGIANKLFVAQHPDVCCTARQVVRGGYTTHRLVDGRRAVAAVDIKTLPLTPPCMEGSRKFRVLVFSCS